MDAQRNGDAPHPDGVGAAGPAKLLMLAMGLAADGHRA
jgi:hypothetical protein